MRDKIFFFFNLFHFLRKNNNPEFPISLMKVKFITEKRMCKWRRHHQKIQRKSTFHPGFWATIVSIVIVYETDFFLAFVSYDRTVNMGWIEITCSKHCNKSGEVLERMNKIKKWLYFVADEATSHSIPAVN